MAQTILNANDVNTFIKDEITAQVLNVGSSIVGGAKLLVLEEDFGKAENLLIEAGIMKYRQIYSIDPVKHEDETICPFCGSENIESVVRPPFLSVLLYFITRIIYIFNKTDTCNDCGKQWKFIRR